MMDSRPADLDERSAAPTDGDAVGELLRLVDRGPEISAERRSRHRALARAHWQRKVLARRRRRRLTVGLAAAAVLVLALGLGLTLAPQRRTTTVAEAAPAATAPSPGDRTPPAAPVARLAAVAGPVHDRSRGQPAALEADAAVAAGAALETGAESRAALRLSVGHELRLDVETRLRLISDSVLVLERGAVYVDSRRSRSSLEIRTPLGRLRDVGTRFEVRLDAGSLTVRVREGVVEVARSGEVHEARTGAEIRLDAGGRIERRAVLTYGPQWRWSLEVAPAFDIEGRTLREFLDWVTRETGWQLFFDPAIATGAAGVILNGSIEGLAPDEALGVVLPTTGLSHRVSEGVLILEPLDRREM